MRTSTHISRVALLSLLPQLCVGVSAGTTPPPTRQPGSTLDGKISGKNLQATAVLVRGDDTARMK